MNYKLLLFGFLSLGFARISAQTFPLQVKEEKLTYVTDERGNRILDYSSCGYRNSEHPIPDVANAVFVSWKPGDNSSRIQRAIDYVASLTPNASGFRGAVLLDRGEFCLSGELRISASGIVLRGMDREKTILLKKGVDRGALIYIEGTDNLRAKRYLAGSFSLCSCECKNITGCFGHFFKERRPSDGESPFRQRVDYLLRV